jgi:magnesium-protoporphyrin IX monomethyl ester (oxidative) cyclase
MGGPNCEGTMGHTLVKNFKFLDYAYSGMANGSFSQIIKALLEEESNSLKKFPQLLSVNSMVNVEDNINNSINLNTIPIPDYDDYFDALGKSKLSSRIKPGLLYESSRGCWHSKCTFCGLNGTLKNYSSKKQSKVFDDLIKLSNKYSTRNIEMTDNVMSKSLFKALIPDLMGLEKKLNIFYETRSNLSEDQIRSLAKAGVKWIQIGIETLNPNIEKLLNKDNHVIDSISILKFCIENGITASWNLLYDIPGDKEEWYYEIDNLIPQIEHLFPPSSVVKLRFDRFSEYHKKANNYNLKLKPRKSYFNIYPFSRNDMDNFAYFFENSSINKCFEKEVVKKIKRKVSTWRENFYNNKKTERSYLVFKEVEKSIYIYDYRKRREPKQYKLTGDTYLIYKACRSPTTINEISKSLKLNNTKHKVQHILDFIAKKGLILNFGDKYLSLATSCQLADFTEFDDFPGGRLLASLE